MAIATTTTTKTTLRDAVDRPVSRTLHHISFSLPGC